MRFPRPTIQNGIIIVAVAYGVAAWLDKPSEIERRVKARPQVSPSQRRAETEAYLKKYNYKVGRMSQADLRKIADADREKRRSEGYAETVIWTAPSKLSSEPKSAAKSESMDAMRPLVTSSPPAPNSTPTDRAPEPALAVDAPAAAPESAPAVTDATDPSAQTVAQAPERGNSVEAEMSEEGAADPDDLTTRVLHQHAGPSLRERLQQKSFTISK